MFVRRCPELSACINSSLWCDNVQHCPSGYDENDINCMQFSAPVMYITIGGGLLLLLTVLILCTSWCKYRQYRKEARLAEKQAARSNLHINNIAQNGDIYCKRYSINSGDFNLYLDRKDSLCWQNISPLETTVWANNGSAVRDCVQRLHVEIDVAKEWTTLSPRAKVLRTTGKYEVLRSINDKRM